jgi:gentisate 1,2-dioxygenase
MSHEEASLDELNTWMQAHHLHGFWTQTGGGPGRQPNPFLWKWADILPGLTRAGDLVPIGPSGLVEMRTVGLRNPSAAGLPGSISLSPQILMPGERTRAHHNLKNETRFVLQAPPGAAFIADGEAFPMEPGDLVVSPTGSDHDHYNGGSKPAIWLDGLDSALLACLGAEVNERYPLDNQYQTIDKPTGFFAATQDRLKGSDARSFHRPPMRYPWADTFANLQALRQNQLGADAYDGFHLRYSSPVDRGPTLPTLSCEIQLLTPRTRTSAHRHNSTAIYHVFRGEGLTEVDGEVLEWTQGDIFCIPPWTWHHHENQARADAILYSLDDWPAMTKMGFYRVEGEAS